MSTSGVPDGSDLSAKDALSEEGLQVVEIEGAGPGVTAFALHGDLDLYTVPLLEAAVRGALAGRTPPPSTLVLDLFGVRFLDSAAIALLLDTHQKASAGGGRLVLAGVQGQARRTFGLMRIENHLNLVGSVEEALGQARRPEGDGHPAGGGE